MERVQTGEVNSYAAHKQYGIPRSTIENHLRGKANGFEAGRPPLFSEEQEKLILDFIVKLSKCPSNKELFQIAKQFACQYEVKLKDRDWTPGDDWLTK